MNDFRKRWLRMTDTTYPKEKRRLLYTHDDAFVIYSYRYAKEDTNDSPFRQISASTSETWGMQYNHSSCRMNNVVVFLLRHFIQSDVIIECLMKMLFSPWYYVSWRRPCYFVRFSMSVQTTRITITEKCSALSVRTTKIGLWSDLFRGHKKKFYEKSKRLYTNILNEVSLHLITPSNSVDTVVSIKTTLIIITSINRRFVWLNPL